MNKRIKRYLAEIEKTEKKIAELQRYLKGVQTALKQEENNEMIKSIRGMKLSSKELFDLLNGIQGGSVSFKVEEAYEEELPEEEKALGDIVINVDRAVEQAKEYGHSTEREMAYLAVHGFLHILGYDHYDPEEKKAMRKAEEDILGACGLQRVITEGRVEND